MAKDGKSGWFAGFPGVVPLARRFIYGAADPKIRNYGYTTPNPSADSNTNYDSMKPEGYRWFRCDELVRRCVVINAAYAMLSAGFETEIEPLEEIESDEEKQAFQEKYKFVKDYVDAANRTVNLDKVLFVAQVNRSVFGKSAFEIQYESGSPSWLLSLHPTKVKPDINSKWELLGYKYDGNVMWSVTEHRLLYFANLELENDREGLSEIEPIFMVCHARHNLLRRDLPEITRSLWAPYAVLSADTSGMSDTAEDAFLDALRDAAKSGKSIVINREVNATVVKIEVNMAGLVVLMDKLEEAIIRNFGTPRFLVNKPNENRATSFTEFEAYVGSTLATIQRYFKRELEDQWYPERVKEALRKNGESAGSVVPLRVCHVWNPIRASDENERAAAVAALYAGGLGILAEFPELAFDMMGWDKKLLQEWQEKQKVVPEQPGTSQPVKPGLPGEETVEPEPGQT